jgi:flagellar L-ring protein precursor FlgH
MTHIAVIDLRWYHRPLVRRALRWWFFVSLAIKAIVLGSAILGATRVHAQQVPDNASGPTSSIFHRDRTTDDGQPLRLSNSSWLFQKSDPPVQVRLHDLITIRVSEISNLQSEGNLNRRKTGKFDAELLNWISLGHLNLKPSPMSNGQPKANGTLDAEYQADSQLKANDLLSFNIAAEIVDIRPNGNLVLEAHQTFRVYDEQWEASLTGICRREDVDPSKNLVLSEKIAELCIDKKQTGAVRDGWRRGWLTRWYDRFQVF